MKRTYRWTLVASVSALAGAMIILEWWTKARVDCLAIRLDQRLRTSEFAEGYLDGLQRRLPDDAPPKRDHLRAVRGSQMGESNGGDRRGPAGTGGI